MPKYAVVHYLHKTNFCVNECVCWCHHVCIHTHTHIYIYIYICIYVYSIQVSQEKRSIFREIIVSVILSKNVYMNMCPIPNGFRDRAI